MTQQKPATDFHSSVTGEILGSLSTKRRKPEPTTIVIFGATGDLSGRKLAPALVASAVAPDGLVEAAELPDDGFVMGVQWHPEVFEMSDPHTQRLFAAFLGAARA